MATRLTDEQKLARLEEERVALLKQIEEKKIAANQTLTEEYKANEIKINELDALETKEIGEIKARITVKRDKLISRNLEIETILAESSDVVPAGA